MLERPATPAPLRETKPAVAEARLGRIFVPLATAPERKDGGSCSRLAFDCELKLAGGEAKEGTITGYGSVFGLLDRGGDIVEAGAFKASLAEWRRKKALPPMLWQHDPYTPVGVWTDVTEDEKGLKVTGELVMDLQQAKDARALIQAGAVKGLSIGYRTKDYEIDRTTGARRLKKVDLWEISLVTFAMLPEAQIANVKSSDFDPRALEAALKRDLGLSNATAVKAVAIVKQHLREGGGQSEHDPRDGAKDMLMSLRRLTESVRA
ncbi:HK97 family phage prohead protease [Bradyrhizobium sp.]|uniref:HK97 family phage prohead protease n=1 Tax=Bradyrhizobium sp. TaxID=376 RepID=UPI0025B7CAC5|nr:HK97 family phage prohead protease [Bradyrhizobium sp.]MCA3254939.1 HK97 family phage prohead protease [Alphaproteobacteria bacterium]MCA3568378.1 HK97 family phage prohead protease [Bradyrhizobium sp.]